MDDWWNLSTKQLIKRVLEIEEPDIELIKVVDSLVEEHLLDAWYFLSAIPVKDIWFVVNNYLPMLKKGDKLRATLISYFCLSTTTLSSTDRKDALKKFFIDKINLDDILAQYKNKETFDNTALDFLEGKVTSAKMYDWAVGQVMKQYPKKYDPKEVKEAIKQRWSY